MTEKINMRVFLLFFLTSLLSCRASHFQSLDENNMVFHSSSSSSSSSEWEQEEFVLGEKKSLVDVLVVADTTPSMYHHLNNLGQALSDLFSAIVHYDWQMGITSVDHGDHENPSGLQQSWRNYILEPHGRFGSLMNWENGKRILQTKILTSKVPDYENVFFHTLSHDPHRECHRPPYCHPPLEQPLRSLKSAMQRAHLDNSSFFRPSADFVSLIITNEKERAEDSWRATQAKQVVQAFNEVFGHLDKKFIAFNILVKDEACLTVEKAKGKVAYIALSVMELAELTGGDNISICSKNYGPELKKLSKHIKNYLENSILLKKEPIPETVRVEFIEGAELDWKQYGRNIVFENRGSGSVYGSVSYQRRN